MSINVTVSSTAAGVSVSVSGGIGPAGFISAPGTTTNAFGTFQLVAGNGITISTTSAHFQIASYGTTAVSSFAPVQSVAGRTGAISLAAADVSGLAAVATSGSYTSLNNLPTAFAAAVHTHDAAAVTSGTFSVARIPTISYTALSGVPATFAPETHTHSTTEVVGLTANFAAANHTHDYAASSHTHDAADVTSGTFSVARIPTISYTALSNVPLTFAPTTHTHSTSDIAGYAGLPSQAGYTGPLVTDGTNASWTSRYSIVDPVIVQGAGMTLTRDTAAGSITVAFAGGTSGVVVSSATPQALGVAAAGSSGEASRADHVHQMPSAADVGAAASSHTHSTTDITGYTLTSVNGLSGTLTLAAGDNVTVSTAGSTITVSAAAGGSGGGGASRTIVWLLR
jgi:hypothetical protein